MDEMIYIAATVAVAAVALTTFPLILQTNLHLCNAFNLSMPGTTFTANFMRAPDFVGVDRGLRVYRVCNTLVAIRGNWTAPGVNVLYHVENVHTRFGTVKVFLALS